MWIAAFVGVCKTNQSVDKIGRRDVEISKGYLINRNFYLWNPASKNVKYLEPEDVIYKQMTFKKDIPLEWLNTSV